jgi:phospholipid/cholesterol/gamma-HCH transport system substrate-binding protein
VIRRTVKFQLVAFALISLLGIFYVGTNYVGIHFLSAGPYHVTLVLPESGGIFTNAKVTERGVTVGRVGEVALPTPSQREKLCGSEPHCVRVVLDIEHEHDKIPAHVHATVANLSAVGEQYLDLEPQTDGAPYLKQGSLITADNATVPLDDATLLVNLDDLLQSVDQQHLATMIEELGKGFDDVGPSLQALIDNGNRLTEAAIASLPDQLALIDNSKTVLDTQNDVAGQLKQWAASFASFSAQLKESDPAIRGVLDNGVRASQQLTTLLRDNQDALPTLLGNLITFNQIQSVRLPYVRATLNLFPAQVAGGFFVTPGDGTAHFGQVNDNNSNPCTEGYQSTRLRGNNDNGSTGSDWGGPANLDAYCKASRGEDVDNHGSRFVPRPDNAQVTNADRYPGPVYRKSKHPTVGEQKGAAAPAYGGGATPSGGGTVIPLPYDPSTGLLTGLDGKTYQLGYHGSLAPIFGSSSWKWLLLAPTMR